jgi:hypothetical protein
MMSWKDLEGNGRGLILWYYTGMSGGTEEDHVKPVRFQVLTAACMMFRVVFWVILPCKMIVDRRFRVAYCLHHDDDDDRGSTHL